MLVELKDVVRVLPAAFDKDLHEALIDEINRKYANKVGYAAHKPFSLVTHTTACLVRLCTKLDYA